MGIPRFRGEHLFARRRLSAYVDDDLRSDEHDRVRRHLDECADCGRMERSLRNLLGGLRLLRARRSARLAEDTIGRVRAVDRPRQRAGWH